MIFFTKVPIKGEVKTRLQPFLTKEQCYELQVAFIKDIYSVLNEMGIDILISHSNANQIGILKKVIFDERTYIEQKGSTLGEKMYNVLSNTLEKYNSCILIGSDVPLITPKDISRAFEILDKKDIVISPTKDGGYYLIGMKCAEKKIFDIEYSNSFVFENTINLIKINKKSYGVGSAQIDIDDKNDLITLIDILNNNDFKCYETRKILKQFIINV